MRSAISALIRLLILVNAVQSFEAATVDPAVWKAGKDAPALREVLSSEDYETKSRSALAAIDRAALLKSTQPAWGVELSRVRPGPGQRLGIGAQDVLISLDDTAIPGFWAFIPMRKPATQQLKAWSPTRGLYTVAIEPGKIGIEFNYSPRWHAELSVLRGAKTTQKWTDDLLVAAACYRDDSALAETALTRAQRAGCKNYLLDEIASLIALDTYRFDDCLQFSNSAMKNAPANDRAPLTWTTYNAALANFKHELACQLAEKNPGIMSQDVDAADEAAFLASWKRCLNERKALPDSQRCVPSPMQQASSLTWHDASAELSAIPGWPSESERKFVVPIPATQPATNMPQRDSEQRFAAQCLANYRGAHHFDVALPDDSAGFFRVMTFGPTAPDVDFTAHYTYVLGKQTSQWSKLLSFSIVQVEGQDCWPVATATFRQDQDFWVASNATPVCDLGRRSELAAGKEIELRMAIVGNSCEIALNGKRVFFAPVLILSSARKLAVLIKMNNCSLGVTDLNWKTHNR
jgi:hypothetical protein